MLLCHVIGVDHKTVVIEIPRWFQNSSILYMSSALILKPALNALDILHSLPQSFSFTLALAPQKASIFTDCNAISYTYYYYFSTHAETHFPCSTYKERPSLRSDALFFYLFSFLTLLCQSRVHSSSRSVQSAFPRRAYQRALPPFPRSHKKSVCLCPLPLP